MVIQVLAIVGAAPACRGCSGYVDFNDYDDCRDCIDCNDYPAGGGVVPDMMIILIVGDTPQRWGYSDCINSQAVWVVATTPMREVVWIVVVVVILMTIPVIGVVRYVVNRENTLCI